MGKKCIKDVLDALLIIFLNLFFRAFQGNGRFGLRKPSPFFCVPFCRFRHFTDTDSDGFRVSVAFRDALQQFGKFKPMQFVPPKVNPVHLTERRPDQSRVLFKTCDTFPVILWGIGKQQRLDSGKRTLDGSFAHTPNRKPFLRVRHQVIPPKDVHHPQDVPKIQIQPNPFPPDHHGIRQAFKQFHFLFCVLLISFDRRFEKYVPHTATTQDESP